MRKRVFHPPFFRERTFAASPCPVRKTATSEQSATETDRPIPDTGLPRWIWYTHIQIKVVPWKHAFALEVRAEAFFIFCFISVNSFLEESIYMQYRGLNELREMYLSFFETKGHLRLPSFSLIPQNDPSLLLINSGMAPMKPFFTGEQEPPRHRVTTCQKCIRTGDIENVGKTARHGTFFEMLGNFSFGDYFKREAIHWSWEFLTSPKWVGIDPDRLYPSIYVDDDEAFEIWNKEIGIAPERIFRFGKEDNFWAVSYTHLDVYKRQRLPPAPHARARRKANRRWSCAPDSLQA